MPVFNDRLWWDLNWRWMVVWLATAATLVVLLAMLNGARRRRRPSERLVGDSTCIYLDDRKIMDVYQMNRYTTALRKEVEQRTRTSLTSRLQMIVPSFIHPSADYERSREVVTNYIEVAEAISVIGVIVDGLERSNAIVHANLRRGTVRRNAALAKARSEGPRNESACLSVTAGGFVLLIGDFERDDAASSETRTVFTAPYGPTTTARVRMSCRTAGLRSEEEVEPDSGPFFALCLGKVRSWRSTDAVLEVRPLAIFS
ncbi:hypothetical protein [Streptomyces sp. NBC_01483]|uniref:hypothetical protein n=1 Tax=Streptomyces sp. NBC_01483 TaxID=2903883 RepID=UPI002E366FD6|nr:hypothetical protein [Streptomyces sp. NBC_01483]